MAHLLKHVDEVVDLLRGEQTPGTLGADVGERRLVEPSGLNDAVSAWKIRESIFGTRREATA